MLLITAVCTTRPGQSPNFIFNWGWGNFCYWSPLFVRRGPVSQLSSFLTGVGGGGFFYWSLRFVRSGPVSHRTSYLIGVGELLLLITAVYTTRPGQSPIFIFNWGWGELLLLITAVCKTRPGQSPNLIFNWGWGGFLLLITADCTHPCRLIQFLQVIKRKLHSLLPNSNLPTMETETQIEGRTMARAVRRRPFTAETQVRSQNLFIWDLWLIVWQWDKFFSDYFYLPLIL
jgi:hypothetical protein